MSKKRDMQRLIRAWKDESGEQEIDMQKVALYALKKGWPMPQPKSPVEMLAKQFSDAAREEIGRDPNTGRPYRVYHAVPVQSGQMTFYTWWDINEAPRKVMHKSLVNRREQMIGDGLQLTLDASYWNSRHPDEEPIALPMDLSLDIEWRLNAPDDNEDAA
ncbi:hypothetical protein [Azospirillum lipoferum]|uniref:Uncharacterized protein n=1 Tax=Azospirillum lipoferum (strain 4B) TaxID=862719 RepID=G7Z7M0_AZOL4|nr:hypothetical protein [Azospirillum lipoferum]CBS85469.1 conserved protein of unknown function [Azospirillum lipoferum 4B]